MNKLSALWQGASYQDHLLQSYRKIHLVVQSVLIGMCAVLTIVAVMTTAVAVRYAFIYSMMLIVTLPGVYLLFSMHRLIRARAEDVDYYHNQIIEFEKSLPKEEQVLTAFKVYQKFFRGMPDAATRFLDFELTAEVRNHLTEKGKGHTRKVLDHYLFIGFYLMWGSLHLIAWCNWLIG